MIEGHLKNLKRETDQLKRLKMLSERQEKNRKIKEDIISIQNELDIFDLDLCNATKRQQDRFNSLSKQVKEEIEDVKNKISKMEEKWNKKNPNEETYLLDKETIKRNTPQPVSDLQRDELIVDVDRRMKEADEDLDDIIITLVQGKNIMEEINIEVKRQQEKMSKVQEEIRDTYSMTKSSKKLISYFKKQIMTDKIICTFVVLVVIAIITILVLYAMGFRGDDFKDSEHIKKKIVKLSESIS